MRFLLPIFLLLSSQVYGAIAFVNAKAGGNTGTTTAVTGSVSHTTGNLLYVSASFRQACSTITVAISDTAGNSFTQIGSYTDNTTNTCIAQYYAKDITGSGSNVVTATASTTVTNLGLSVLQFSGLDTTSPLDSSATITGKVSSSFTATTSAFSTATADEVVACGFKAYSFGAFTAGTGYTIPTGATDAFHGTQSAQYKIYSSTQSSITTSFTQDTSVINTIACTAFSLSGVGGGGGGGGGSTPVKRRVIN